MKENSKIRDVGAFLLLVFAAAAALFFTWATLVALYWTDYPVR